MALAKLPVFIRDNYEVKEWRHASSILQTDFPELLNDIVDVLSRFRLRKSEIVVGGGRKTKIADWLDSEFTKKGWKEHQFETIIEVDKRRTESPTHKVDCFKATEMGGIGFEIEWNNKDPFFDRDLNNFRLLFELRTISVGIILTRSEDLKALFAELTDKGLKPASSFGESTTHWDRLLPRLDGGGGGGCPVLAFGIKRRLYVEDVTDAEALKLIKDSKEEKKERKRAAAEKRRQKLGAGAPRAETLMEDEQDDYDS